MDFKNFSLLIIAGGKNSQLGQDKRFIEVGEKNLLENILQKAQEKDFFVRRTGNFAAQHFILEV